MSINLTNLLANQVTGYGTFDDNYNVESLKKINFITAANGLFRVEKTPTAIFKTKVQEYKKPIPGLHAMAEGVDLLVPKIPFKFLQMALSFYLDIYDKDKTEASLLFFWNKDNKRLPERYSDNAPVKGLLTEGQLVVYVPRQKNSSGLSEFHMDPVVDWLRTNLTLLAETHSHHTMGAFFSGTDDANENATQFYGVWGKIKDQQPQFAFRYCSGETKAKIDPNVLFDWPEVKTTTTSVVTSEVEGFEPITYVEEDFDLFRGPFQKLDYPTDWMEQHTKSFVAKVTPKSKYPSAASRYPYAGSDYLGGRGYRQIEWDDYEEELNLFKDIRSEMEAEDAFARRFDLDKSEITDQDGIEHAHIVDYTSFVDENASELIEQNVADIAEDFKRLGFDAAIENNIKAARKQI